MESPVATRREYFDDMFKLQSKSTFLSILKEEDGRLAMVLDSTIFHPQGGGQPADHGYISGIGLEFGFKFVVNDVRSKDGDVILHYGFFEDPQHDWESKLEKGQEVSLHVDQQRRELNARLHSAGHVLDVCLLDVGLSHLEAGRGYHFPDGPWVEYKGTIPKDQFEVKQKELEMQANKLISDGLEVHASVLSYEEASKMCGGSLPSYIPKGGSARIVKLGDYPGCPCGGTHVANLANIMGLKVTSIRVKKGQTKVYYTIGK